MHMVTVGQPVPDKYTDQIDILALLCWTLGDLWTDEKVVDEIMHEDIGK